MSIEVRGFNEAMKHLDAMKHRLSANGRTFPEISGLVVRSIQANFQAGGRDPQWPERKYTYPWPILNKTGRMKDSSVQDAKVWTHRGGEHVLQVTSTPYAKFHQYGTKRLPIRKFVKLLEAEMEQVRAILRRIFQ